MRIVVVFTLCFGLMGCLGGPGGGGRDSGHATKRLNVSQGQITVVGPEGYCIASSSVREDTGGAFVPLAPCVSLSGKPSDEAPAGHYFLAASVQRLTGDLALSDADLVPAARQAVQAGAIRAALGAEVEVLSERDQDNALIVKTRAKQVPDGLDEQQWRAIFLRRGHLVSLSLTGFDRAGSPISEDMSEAVLLAFLAKMQAANPEG